MRKIQTVLFKVSISQFAERMVTPLSCDHQCWRKGASSTEMHAGRGVLIESVEAHKGCIAAG